VTLLCLSRISHEHGEIRKNSPDVLGANATADTASSSFYLSELPADELAARAAQKTLVDGPDPDLVIYAASDFSMTTGIGAAQCGLRLGLHTTEFLVVTGHACANVGASLGVANGVISTNPSARILLVTVGKRGDDLESRIVGEGVALLSDAAASCFITGPETVTDDASCEVLGWHVAVDVTAEIEASSPRRVLQTAALMKRATAELSEKLDLKIDDLDLVLLSNVNPKSRAFLAWAIGVPDHKVFQPSTEAEAHMFAADTLVGINSISSSYKSGSRKLVLVVSPGVKSVAMILAVVYCRRP